MKTTTSNNITLASNNKTAPIEALFKQIEDHLKNKKRLIMAIDGPCTSGKTTLATRIAKRYPANIYHLDDFYLTQVAKETVNRDQAGWNSDHQRFIDDVLKPLQTGKPVSYRAFNCQEQRLLKQVVIKSQPVEIIEGVYAHHPKYRRYYNLTVFLSIEEQAQQARLLVRNGAKGRARFNAMWIPLENEYFDYYDIIKKANMVIVP